MNIRRIRPPHTPAAFDREAIGSLVRQLVRVDAVLGQEITPSLEGVDPHRLPSHRQAVDFAAAPESLPVF